MADQPRYKLEIDLNKCVGHGRCYDVASVLFAPDDDEGRAKVLVADISADKVELARLAVDSCPEEAITLRKV